MAATKYQSSRNGRLFVAADTQYDGFMYAGAARMDAVAGTRSMVSKSNGMFGQDDMIWTGSITVRTWGDSPIRALVEGDKPFGVSILYGNSCDPVNSGDFDRAIVIDRAVATGNSWASPTTMSSGEGLPVDEIFAISAANIFVVNILGSLIPVESTTGIVLASAVDGEAVYALCGVLSGANHALTLYRMENARTESASIGTYSASTAYALAVTRDHILMLRSSGIYAIEKPAPGTTGLSSGANLILSGTYAGLQSIVGGAMVLGGDGSVREISDDLSIRYLASAIGIASATYAGFSERDGLSLFGSASRIVSSYKHGRLFVGTLPGSDPPVHVYRTSGGSIVSFSGDSVHYSANGGVSWDLVATFPDDIVRAAFSSDLLAYAVTNTGSGHEVWVSASGGRRWRQVESGLSVALTTTCLTTMRDGGVLIAGRLGTGGVGDSNVQGVIYTISPTKQAIAGA